jgi:DNA primase
MATTTNSSPPSPRASRGWVDFRELRSKLRFADVLDHYDVRLKVRGERATGFCPLPDHDVGKSPDRKRSPSFSANLARGIWQCFGCGKSGNALDLAARMEGLDPADGRDLRKAAMLMQETFGLNGGSHDRKSHDDRRQRRRTIPPAPSIPLTREGYPKAEVIACAGITEDSRPVFVNRPLDFVLKDLDPAHPYLAGRGFTPETIAHFGLGFCHRGLLKGRIAIPIRDGRELLAYAGRIVDDALISESCPKYLFPGPRDRKGERHEFHKSLLVYNLHKITAPVMDLIVVEGFPSVWWLWQHGCADAIALMGSSCSDEQADILKERVRSDGRLWVMTDGDDAGERCAAELFRKCGSLRSMRYVRLRPGEQPTDCDDHDLAALLASRLKCGAEKSGTSTQPAVANPAKNSNDRASATAAFR